MREERVEEKVVALIAIENVPGIERLKRFCYRGRRAETKIFANVL